MILWGKRNIRRNNNPSLKEIRMTFTTLNLTNERVLVKGTDVFGGSGSTTLDATQWNELKIRKDLKAAQEDFDAAVEEFYAPLMAAAEKAEKVLEKPEDSAAFVVLDEGTEGVSHRDKQIVALTRDSIILRLIESGNTDRLIWVNDELEILEVLANTHQVTAPATAVEQGDPFN